jgi:uncharacterized membrane protein
MKKQSAKLSPAWPFPSESFLAYFGVLVLAAAWICPIFAVPSFADGGDAQKHLAGVVRIFFSPICHQIPERSFFINGHPLAVCARCTGIYAGFFLGLLIYPFHKIPGDFNAPPIRVLWIAALPTASEWLLSHTCGLDSSNWVRCSAGAVIGAALAFWVLPAVFELLGIKKQTEE